eukprot:203068_1
MGACLSSDENRKLSLHISDEINTDKKKLTEEQKILFLGSGGSGKSTLFKQLRLIHGSGFSDLDREGYIKYIHLQIVNQMKSILQIYIGYNHRQQQRDNKANGKDIDDDDELVIFDDLKLESPPLQHMEPAELILNYKYDKLKHCLPPDICAAITTLWAEQVIKEIYDLRHITRIETSSKHFWDKLETIQNSNYLPSIEDILLNRFITTGLHEQRFDVEGNVLHIIDVGGQRSQRRKWMHCFEYVVAVIFIASLSCYDAVLPEDTEVNQMTDQIELFGNIINNRTLHQVAMILFLNKKDLFQKKYCIDKIPLNKCEFFEDYTDHNCDYTRASKYICDVFQAVDRSQERKIFTHLTCATDTNNIDTVFKDVREIIMQQSLVASGLLN